MRVKIAWVSVALAACAASPRVAPERSAGTPGYVLLDRAGEDKADGLPVFRELSARDARRGELERLLARPYLRWVLDVGAEARRRARGRCHESAEVCSRRFDHPAYFAIIAGGNRPQRGLALAGTQGLTLLPDVWYVEIDPQDSATLIPHEYGHVMMFESLVRDLPDPPQTLPHTTGAITNDVVAFTEGWGIHFETLGGDRREMVEAYGRLHRDDLGADSLLPAKDLLSYAQGYRRYTCIKENCFAFLPRTEERLVAGATPTTADIVARWTDTSYDPARLRSLEQMAASEGVIAALFYRLASAPAPGGADGAPGDPPLPAPARYAAFFDAFARVSGQQAPTTPTVLAFLQTLLEAAAPDERARIARIALEVLHYTPALPDAARLYAELHAAGHQMDGERFLRALEPAKGEMEKAVRRLAEDPGVLAGAAAPCLWLENDAFRLDLPVFEVANSPLVLDLNTAPVEFLMTIPGVGYREAIAIAKARTGRRGFRNVEDAAGSEGMRPQTAEAIQTMRRAYLASVGR